MGAGDSDHISRSGRRAALWIAGTGLFWILATLVGGWLGLSTRTRALFDLIALAGFGWGLYLTFRTWRARQEDKG